MNKPRIKGKYLFQFLKSIYVKFKIIVFIIVISGLLIFIYYLRYPIAGMIGNTLIIHGRLEKADIILVHAGDPVRRLPKAYKIYQQKLASEIWITASTPEQSATNFYKIFNIFPCEADSYAAALKNVSIKTSQFKIYQGTLNTYDDCRLFYSAYIKHPFKKAIVVSDPIHSYRIKMCLDHFFPDEVKFIFALNDEETFRKSHTDPEDYVNKVFNELVKVWIYRYRLWTSWKNKDLFADK